VIGSAFELIDLIRVLEPARLIDLADASGLPRPTAHRLLAQLIEVGAVRKEGTNYRLGTGLLSLGEQVTTQRRLRLVARRPLAELAVRTGAGVSLTAGFGDEAVYLESMDAYHPLAALPEVGGPLLAGTAQARVQGIDDLAPTARRPMMCVDAGEVIPGLSCVAVAVPLPLGGRATVCAAIMEPKPSRALLAATRAAAARIAGLVGDAQPVGLASCPKQGAERGRPRARRVPSPFSGIALAHRSGAS
jgi:DNA-binding IclR family transcriptional regulator